ncbi:DNA (cytosine-5-)-methyltransferase [Alkaliphilus peptidifermentans]|uniref:Cytosine-specific methyltransferase n=1 Tax=Alkaliphilus peptidifermentans DSM 18978 TaxID=1120976 RepID=A0A1G5EIJ8_9FIRM|nr:DNA (cytosine-5-)-methyltransferase [Alkaliphilus peptidifermentans]SCY26772.1 DNA-methyltransferase (dcm) [Alkaliphilus peptidifermentans DSM 18978]
MDKKRQKYRVVSLFSGIGGFEEGLKYSNLEAEVIFSSEIDKYAQKSYLANYPNHNLNGDITKIEAKTIPDHDILVGGFPCQAFSIAGKRNGFDDTRGTLFFDIARIIKEKQPKVVFLENVKNLVSHDNFNTIKVILNTLNELGYTVDFTVINSSEMGVPQSRDRTYIVGIKDIIKPQRFKEDYRSRKINKLKQELNNKDFIGFNFFDTLKPINKKIFIKDILEEKVDKKYFIDNEGVKKYLENINININDTKEIMKIIKILDLPREVHNDQERQRRVYSTNGISPTVLARSDSAKILVKENGQLKLRKFTPIENFRVQGFEDEFIEKLRNSGVSDTQLYKQSGNAVSPPVIREIFNHIEKFLNLNNEDSQAKFIDLFAGLGGFRIALESNGGKCVFSSEIDKYARETYKTNFGEEPSGDIIKINTEEIPDHDILCAGFPCQPFSIAGKRLGFEDARGTLFFEVARILRDKRPRAFILENVSGIVSHDNGNTLSTILSILKELKYSVVWKVLNAKDYGIPQNRNRWYCVGVDNNIYGELSEKNIFPHKTKLTSFMSNFIEENVDSSYIVSEIAKKNMETHIEDFIDKGKHKEDQPIIANNIRPSKVSFSGNGISPCLTAKMGTGGNNVPVIYSLGRKLTEKECLRIMGFPENYKIKPNYSQSYKQIGNSVVVKLIEQIAKNLIIFLKVNY